MALTEWELYLATQMAYCDVHEGFKELSAGGTKPVSLTEALAYTIDSGGAKCGNFDQYVNISKENGKTVVTFKEEYKVMESWSILSVGNDNDAGQSGFYGMILDSGEERILACRGSEGMESETRGLQNWKQDWYGSDLKLLNNSTGTPQELALEKYMKENAALLGEKEWVTTGHSLGGALADHGAIMSAKLGIPNYSGTVSFDGPGHSQEYIDYYKDEIAQVAGKMKHKKASAIGELLFDIPGVEQTCIKTERTSRFVDENGNPINEISGFGLLGEIFLSHDTQYWRFDENGNCVEGEQSAGEFLFDKLSKYMDRLPPAIGNTIVEVANIVANGVYWVKDFLDEHPEFMDLLIMNAIKYVVTHPSFIIASLKVVGYVIVAVAVIAAVAVIGELIIEKLEELALKIAEAVCNAVEWLKGKAAELFEAINEAIGDIRQWFRETFNKGYKFAQSNPWFRADTDKLRGYASRLSSVNRRLRALDGAIRGLYWQVGLLDLWDILYSNILISESRSLDKARKYLNNTADRLEKADNKANNYMGG